MHKESQEIELRSPQRIHPGDFTLPDIKFLIATRVFQKRTPRSTIAGEAISWNLILIYKISQLNSKLEILQRERLISVYRLALVISINLDI